MVHLAVARAVLGDRGFQVIRAGARFGPSPVRCPHACLKRQERKESKQASRFFSITVGSGLPFQQTTDTIESSQGVDVSNEIVAARDRTGELDLQVSPRLADTYAVVLSEALQQLDTLLKHVIPRVPLGVFETTFPIGGPLPEQRGCRIFTAEKSSEGAFEGSPE